MSETRTISVRYWASARSAAGVDGDGLDAAGPISLAEVLGAWSTCTRAGGSASAGELLGTGR